jgi:hypothetical protein
VAYQRSAAYEAERNARRIRHSVVSCFAIVGATLAFAFYGIWALQSAMMLPGWRYAAIWALVSVGGGIAASLPVRFVFWLFQRSRRTRT